MKVLANFSNGEQEILDNLNRGVSNIKERLMPVLNNKDLDNNSVSNEMGKGKARVLINEKNPFKQYITTPLKEEKGDNTSYSNIASGDSGSDSFINNQSATSFVVVIMAILTFILVSVILGYGLFNLLNL